MEEKEKKMIQEAQGTLLKTFTSTFAYFNGKLINWIARYLFIMFSVLFLLLFTLIRRLVLLY